MSHPVQKTSLFGNLSLTISYVRFSSLTNFLPHTVKMKPRENIYMYSFPIFKNTLQQKSFFFFFSFFFFTATSAAGEGLNQRCSCPCMATAPATLDASCICDLRHSLWQCRILNPLIEARDPTQVLTDTNQVLNLLSHNRNSQKSFLMEIFPKQMVPVFLAEDRGLN